VFDGKLEAKPVPQRGDECDNTLTDTSDGDMVSEEGEVDVLGERRREMERVRREKERKERHFFLSKYRF
jgi:hypothetical protein